MKTPLKLTDKIILHAVTQISSWCLAMTFWAMFLEDGVTSYTPAELHMQSVTLWGALIIATCVVPLTVMAHCVYDRVELDRPRPKYGAGIFQQDSWMTKQVRDAQYKASRFSR